MKLLLPTALLFLISGGVATVSLIPTEICKCRYEGLWWLGVWWAIDCYADGGCAEECDEQYHSVTGTYKCRCDGIFETCTCYGQTVYAGMDPETNCVHLGCAGTNTCKKLDTSGEEPAEGWYLICNCRP